jgi:hypothetical protein
LGAYVRLIVPVMSRLVRQIGLVFTLIARKRTYLDQSTQNVNLPAILIITRRTPGAGQL